MAPALSPENSIFLELLSRSDLAVAVKDAQGAPQGVTVDLLRFFAAQTMLPLDMQLYDNSGEVTDAVMDEVKTWQSRPLDAVYPIVYLDCLHVKVREGAVRVKAVYLAIGVTLAGEKEVLGLWLAQTEGAKFWLQVAMRSRPHTARCSTAGRCSATPSQRVAHRKAT